ncbi:TylF/MycF family methyltransferase [Paraburkholderia hospita]|uniref:TylF/MycF family methyltransferase n=1 Tax=Paraburkholderia hospita TaxID=169430 RepID=UPI0002718B05|nr:TylF/MycF family methyltransferase [Paraburkholderia hospita]EUC14718.1 macrocin-O-methyltransferase [Burkholderia sp. BT03]SKC94028.1 Macrocin-O-methyltransferase (TylF) [Paraburkholderia hospita]
MSIRMAVRRVALAIPPLRRLYEFALQQASENEALRQAMGSHGQLSELKAKLLAAESARESLELQLYVLNSDHQRASTRNEALAALLREATQREQNITDTRADQYSQVASLFDLHYAKLSGRITMLSSEITALRPNTADNELSTRLYLDLLEDALTGTLFKDDSIAPWAQGYDPDVRAVGRDWPSRAYTMIGSARLRNLRVLAERVLSERVPGDMIEAGVWRGGASILMRGVLAAYGVTDRKVWVADSFAGLPPPEEIYPADAGDLHSTADELRVSLETVKEHFDQYKLLDQQVQFLKGWFKDTLPTAPIERLAILRLDGDMYSSTIQTLNALYQKVSPSGFIIVDGYALAGCRQAVDDYRQQRDIREPLQEVDGAAVFWRKSN